MLSPMGRNVLHCSLRYNFTVSCVSVVNFQVIKNFYWQSVSRADVHKARVLLLFVRLGNFHLFDYDIQSLIVCLCTDYSSASSGLHV